MAVKKTAEDADIVKSEMPEQAKSENKTNYVDKARENPWIVSTIVLGLVLILVLIMGGSGLTGSAVSSTDAGQNLIDFINSRGQDLNPEIVSVEKDGALYSVVVKVDGQDTPLFVTLDGKYAITNPIPLVVETEETNTGEIHREQNQVNNEIPKSNKPVVELFVMSYCPYGTQIEKGIIPAAKLLGDKIDFELKFVNYAMHPTQGEVEENTRQYCIQKEQGNKFLDYMACFLESGDSAGCIAKTNINKAKMDSCYSATDKKFDITKNLEDKSSWSGGRFPKYLVNEEDNLKYGIQGSPTLIINGVEVSSARDSASLLKTICGAFNTAPSECQTEFSSAQPSPGFGLGTTDSANLAQCG